jgi:hypothetical protein
MEPVQWIMLLALTLFLAEGFTLSVFPAQMQQMLAEIDPRVLQMAGLVETIVAVALMAGILVG